MIKSTNPRLCGIEKGTEIQTKGTETKIIAENFPNLRKDIDTQVQEAFSTPIAMTTKEPHHPTS
jgi:hypothetical protein